jgi:hypothetical protein
MSFYKFPKLAALENYWTTPIFLRWWLFFALISLGILGLFLSGLVQKISQGDITRISFLIFGIFIVFTIRTGIDTFNLSKENGKKIDSKKADSYMKRNEVGWFVSDILLTLGMIGTVIGFIYMMSASFSELDPGNTNSMQAVLVQLSTGMSTAFYTTATGLVCSLLLKLQLFNFSNHLDFLHKPKETKNEP